MSAVLEITQPAHNLNGMSRASHDFGRGIEAREAGTIAIGNPFVRNAGNLIEAKNSVFQIRSRAMRVASKLHEQSEKRPIT